MSLNPPIQYTRVENRPTTMSKTTISYTTRDLRELGFFVEVPGRTDTDKTRKKALEEIQRRMEDPEDTTLSEESFANGLSAEDLVVVEPPEALEEEGEEPEIIQAVKAIATLASLRVTSEEAYKGAVELRPLIEALFSPQPLTPEQMQQATDKSFAKTLIKFAEAKAAHDKFLPAAQEAWDILAPTLPAATNENSLAPESEAASSAADTAQEVPKKGQKASTS